MADGADEHGGEQPRPPKRAERSRARARRLGRTHPWSALAGAVVLAALVVVGVVVIHRLRVYESTDDAQVDGHIAAISPRVGGTVTAVLADENQRVQRGEVLVELDPRDYAVEVQR